MSDFRPHARVIADSLSPAGCRLTTIEVSLHRFVLAELNTHRVFSRNSASSRAIPIGRSMARLADWPVYPTVFPAEQRGMSGGGPLPSAETAEAREIWAAARDAAVGYAEKLAALGVHKSVANRLLEPFMFTTVIVTATDWNGFWAQRCNRHAQPELRAAANAMRVAYLASTPEQVHPSGWHLPYIDDQDRAEVSEAGLGNGALRRISAARCARVSYLTHDGRRDHSADLDLYARLVAAAPPHASPLEHVATPAEAYGRAEPRGNFRGWHQLRHLVLGDALVDLTELR